MKRQWLGLAFVIGCASHERHVEVAEPVERWAADRARIFAAAEEAMRVHAVIDVSDERGRVLRGHMGPYVVKIVVPVDVAQAEIRCSRADEWSAAAIRRDAREREAVAAAEGQVSARSCVDTLERAIESRLDDGPPTSSPR